MLPVIETLIAESISLDEGEGALSLTVDGMGEGAREGIVTIEEFGLVSVVGFRPYVYEYVRDRMTGLSEPVVIGVAEVPYFIDPARIIAVRHADNLPPA